MQAAVRCQRPHGFTIEHGCATNSVAAGLQARALLLLALPWRKTLEMLGLGAESIIVRADEEKLSPAPWRLSFLCTLAPAAADLDKCDAVQQSEALRSQYWHQ